MRCRCADCVKNRKNWIPFGLPYGKFERSLELSRDLDFGRMRADLHHGVLDVHIPVQQNLKAHTVPVYEAEIVAVA